MAKTKVTENGNYLNMMRKLTLMKKYDQNIESARKTWGTVTLLSGLVAFLSIFGISVFPPIAALTILAAVVFVFSLIVYIINVRKDLDNRKLDSAIRFVEMIGQDVPPEKNIALFIDFGDYQKAGKLLNKQGGVFSVREYEYEHPWLKCSGVLFDGNKFDLEVTQCVKRKEKPKRKYTKVKEKIVEKATLNMKLNPDVYPSPKDVSDSVRTGQLPHGFTVRRALGTDRCLKISAMTPPAVLVHGRYGTSGDREALFDGDKLLGLVVDAYAGLQDARPEGQLPPE